MSTYGSYSVTVGAPVDMTDTQWRDFITHFCAALDAVGLTRTSDSGQFDPATVARPTTSSYIYEVRQLTAASTAMLVIIEFSGTEMRHTVCATTDGAGSAVGKYSGPHASLLSGANVGGSVRSSGSDVHAGVVVSNSVYFYGFIVGVVDGELVTLSIPRTMQSQISMATLTGAKQTDFMFFSPGYPELAPSTGTAPIYRVFVVTDSAVPQEVPFAVVIHRSNLPDLDTFTAGPYGTARTWLSTGCSPSLFSKGITNYGYRYRVCVRFD